MNKDEFERAILDLWLTTQIPLTRAHLQYHTGLGRKKVEAWLDELVVEGVLGVDVDDNADMIYTVSGATRPSGGATSFAQLDKLSKLKAEVSSKAKKKKRKKTSSPFDSAVDLEDLHTELVVSHAKGLARKASQSLTKREEGEKSLLISSALSFFFGPLGWFYAGSYKEAAVGSLAYLAIAMILPSFLLSPLLFLAMPISGVAGLVYAWQHNRAGERRPLLKGKSDDD